MELSIITYRLFHNSTKLFKNGGNKMAWKSEEDYNLESEFWNPEEGDVLEGDVLLVKKGNYEKLFMIIEDEDGNSWITTQCARLDFQIKKMKIEEGDIVKLTYNGRVGENDAHDYKLEVWEED